MFHLNKPVAAICLAVTSAFAQAQQATYDFDIPAQPAIQVLEALAKQTGLQPFFAEGVVKGAQSPGVKGTYSLRDALDRALAGTGLTYQFTGEKAVAVKAAPATDEKGGKEASLPTVNVTAVVEKSYKAAKVAVASKQSLTPREIPNSVSVLTRQQMDDQVMTTMPEAMQQITGVTVTTSDALAHEYLIRGYAPGVMYDGVATTSNRSLPHQFDLSLYERVEVMRGPTGLLRGVGDPGGVINMVKKRPKDTYSLSWAASTGSWGNYRGEGDITGPLNQDKTLRGRLVLSKGDRQYFYDHTHAKKSLAFGAIEYDLTPRTTLSLSLSSQDHAAKVASGGLPRYTNGNLLDVPRSTNNLPNWNRKSYRTDETSASVEHRFDNKWVAKASLNHRMQHLYEKQAYYSTGVNPTTDFVTYRWNRTESDYTRDGLDIYVNGPFVMLGRTHNLLLGYNSDVTRREEQSVTANLAANVNFGNLAPIAVEPSLANQSGRDVIIAQHGIYSQLRLSIADPLTLVLGGRSTTYRSKSRSISPSVETDWVEARDKANNQVTPYGGVLYDVTKQITLYGSYADIFIPQAQQQFNGGTLEPRVGYQYELGSKVDFLDGKLGGSLALFNVRDKNRAYADPDHATFYLAAGEIESKGWEVEVVGKPLTGLEIMVGYTRLTTRYLKDRNNEGLQFSLESPKDQLKLWANYRFSDENLAGLSLGLGIQANSGFSSLRNMQGQGGYAVANGHIGYQIDRTYSLSLLVNNLFDRKYYTSLGSLSGGNVYGEPRNFLLTLRATY